MEILSCSFSRDPSAQKDEIETHTESLLFWKCKKVALVLVRLC